MSLPWCCEYCGACFSSCPELALHIHDQHPGQAFPNCCGGDADCQTLFGAGWVCSGGVCVQLTETYPMLISADASSDSVPVSIQVQFTLNGVAKYTPYAESLPAGSYRIVFPLSVVIDGVTYDILGNNDFTITHPQNGETYFKASYFSELPPTPVKTAEIEVHMIRFPYVTDDYVKNGIVGICNSVFAVQYPSLEARNPRLTKGSWSFWKCTVDVYDNSSALSAGSVVGLPIPWLYIAGLIIGAILAGCLLYFIAIRPLKATLVEISEDLRVIMDDKHKALADGLIDQQYADELDALLEEAKEKAEEGGYDPWMDWTKFLQAFGELFKYLPYVILAFLGLAFLSYLPRKD